MTAPARTAWRTRNARLFDVVGVFGLVVLLLGLPVSEAAKSIGLGLAFLGFVGSLAFDRAARLLTRPAALALLAYVAAGVVSLVTARPGFRSGESLFWHAATAMPYLMVGLACRRPSRRVLLSAVILLGAWGGAAVGIAEFSPHPTARLGLPSAGNPVPAAEYLGAVLAMTIAILAVEWRSRVRGPILALGLVATAVALVMTKSRGPLIGAAAGAVTAFGLSLKSARRALLMLAVLAAGVVVLGRLLPEARLVGDQMWRTRTASARVFVWRRALDVIAERPVTGHGPGSFVRHGIVYEDDIVGAELQNSAHNTGLNVAAETGLLGCGTLAAFLVLGIRGALRGAGSARRPLDRAIVVGSVAGAVAILASGVFSVSTDAEPGLLLFALLGLAQPQDDGPEPNDG